MAARLGSQLMSCPLYVWSLLKQLVLLAAATSGGDKLLHVIVFCVEKGFLLFFQLKFTTQQFQLPKGGLGMSLWHQW